MGLDLSDQGVVAWWGARPRRAAETAFEAGAREAWAVDGPGTPAPARRAVVEALARLGAAMDGDPGAVRAALLAGDPPDAPGFPAALRKAMVHMSAPRRLRLMSWLADLLGDGVGPFLGRRRDPDTRMIRASLRAMHRERLLGEMFAPGRLDFILAAVEGGPGNAGDAR